MSGSVWPHRWQPNTLPHPWDSPGKNIGVGCHFLLQCMKVNSESEVAQSCRLLATPWTAAHQAPPCMGFSRQEYWSGMPLPSPSKFHIYMLIHSICLSFSDLRSLTSQRSIFWFCWFSILYLYFLYCLCQLLHLLFISLYFPWAFSMLFFLERKGYLLKYSLLICPFLWDSNQIFQKSPGHMLNRYQNVSYRKKCTV